MANPAPGWFLRQTKAVEEEVRQWPRWMRVAAGLEPAKLRPMEPLMSDFCRGCSEEHFGKDFGELAGLCAPGECASTLCEGCGYILVDHLGVKIAEAGPRPATAQYYQFATFPFPAQGDEVAEDDTL